jgi:protein involved in polysaccharide export with SLBB domain
MKDRDTMNKYNSFDKRGMSIFALGFILLCIALAGCASGDSTIPVSESAGEYTLGVGDKLRVNVYGQEELSQEYTVEAGGIISIPLIGSVRTSGYTAREIEKSIADKLHPGYLVNPKVSVEVINFRNVYVLGEVQQPGKYEYAPNMTVLQAVASASGYTYRANENSAEVTRHVKGALSTFTVTDKTMLKPGDTILIKRRWF